MYLFRRLLLPLARLIKHLKNYLKVTTLRFMGVQIGRRAHIRSNVIIELSGGTVRLDDHVFFDYGVIIRCHGGELVVGHHTFINAHTMVIGGGNVYIGANTAIAPYCIIVASNHVFSDLKTNTYDQGLVTHGITIGDNVWIGAGSRILDGVTIGNGAVIGAGSVVTNDIPPNAVAMGIPAKVTRIRH